MVTIGSRTADVGCDHGFVSIYLYEKGIAPKVYAMDLREGPLGRAREHIAARGFSDYIETRLSDGLEALAEGEADALVCAGMGGRLMAEILSEGRKKAVRLRELILQPQSELRYFREFLRRSGYVVAAENMVKEDGKFYTIIKAVYGGEAGEEEPAGETLCGGAPAEGKKRSAAPAVSEETWQRIADSFGACLLAARHPVLREYLKMLWERDTKILKSLGGAGESQGQKDGAGRGTDGNGTEACRRELRKKEVLEELSDIERCLALYGEEGEVL